jgi:hypothetical protein
LTCSQLRWIACPGRWPPGSRPGAPRATAVLGRILSVLERKPTAGWALRRGQLAHGVTSPVRYLNTLREYTLAGRAGQIRCPTLVCNAEGDDISASAPQLADALNCPKEFITFTAAQGAGDHCEAAARTLYHARSFGWLDQILHAR